jgi:hypothetical protein
MRDTTIDVPTRLLAVLVALTLGLVAGCGGDDDGDGGGNANASQSENGGASAPGGGGSASDREQVAAVMPEMRALYNAADGKAFCAGLTAAGKKEVSQYATEEIPQLNTRDCATFMTRYAEKVVASGGAQRPVRVRKVEIDGDTAKVTMQGGLAGIRSIAVYTLAKEAGDWKLEDPISGAETRKLPAKYQQQ